MLMFTTIRLHEFNIPVTAWDQVIVDHVSLFHAKPPTDLSHLKGGAGRDKPKKYLLENTKSDMNRRR